MGLVYPDLPTVGQPNSTEQPKVRQSLIDLRDTINGAVDTDNLATGAVTTVKLDDDAVTAAKLADSAVDSGAIASDAVTGDKLSLTNYTVTLSGDVTNTLATTSTVFTSAPLTTGLWLVIAEVDVALEDNGTADYTLAVGASTIGASRIQVTYTGSGTTRHRCSISALTTGGDVITLTQTATAGAAVVAKSGNSRMQIVRLG